MSSISANYNDIVYGHRKTASCPIHMHASV